MNTKEGSFIHQSNRSLKGRKILAHMLLMDLKKRREDYFNAAYGLILEDLILEDMHDENVLRRGNLLFFIDTVFYTVTATRIR